MAQYLVLGASRYDFINKETGERVNGLKVTYVDTPENTDTKLGFTPISISCEDNLWHSFTSVPAIYDFDFGMKATKVGGRPTVVLKSLKFVKEVKLPS